MTFKELQKRGGFTQEELATMLDIKQPAISAFMTGKTFSAKIAHAIF